MGQLGKHILLVLAEAWDSPWKVGNEIHRLLLFPIARLHFRVHGVRWKTGWRIHGLPLLQRHRSGKIVIGEALDLRSAMGSNPLAPNHPVVLSTRRAGSRIVIGNHFAMTGGTICADVSVEIGNRVNVGANCLIVDTDFHPLDPSRRLRAPNQGECAPVVIEDDVFIGMNCLVLKGVRLGRGCVIGAGSVVTSDVPPGMIAAGNPARPIRRVQQPQCVYSS